MKNSIAGCLLFLGSLSSLAASSVELIGAIADAYYELGDDNNSVSIAYLPSTFLDIVRSKAERLTGEALIEGIKECLFMTKGIYGDHLSSDLQDRLSNAFAAMISQLTSYKVDPVDFAMNGGTFNAPCVLAVEDAETSQVVFMQASAND